LQELAKAAQDNPFAAMSKVQELGIPPEVLQQILMTVMSNPSALIDLAKQFGADDSTIQSVQDGLDKLKGK
jgi:spore maturation protein SpmB